MKYLIFITSLLFLSCNREDNRQINVFSYNCCTFFEPYKDSDSVIFNSMGLVTDGQYRSIKIIDANFNFLNNQEILSFYGILKGVDMSKDTFNIIAFDTKISRSSLLRSPDLAVMLYRKIPCSTFNSSIDLVKLIDTSFPVVTGSIVEIGYD